MKIEINIDELKKNKLFVATPMYGGLCYGLYLKSCLDLQSACTHYGIEIKFSFLMNESLVQRSRNYLSDEFLSRTDCTHFMFIDADIVFNAMDIITLMALDRDIIGGVYPKKTCNWDQLHKAIQKNSQIPASEYENLTGSMVFNPVKGMTQFSITEPVEIMDLGTGFTMYKREVFEKFQECHPEQMYRPDHQTEHFNSSREICAFFDCKIDSESKRYLSEDYYFTQECRKMGIKTWMCPWIELKHIGTYHFGGSFPSVARHLGSI